MMRSLNPFEVITELRTSSTEAVLGQSGLNHPALATEIRRRFGGASAIDGGLVREAVVEAAFPFLAAEPMMGELSGGLLHPSIVAALDQAGDPRIGRDWHPYRHQLQAWEKLTQPTPHSVLVASGTGSGKTECFLVPLLDDLAREAETTGPLSGVRAIALYPLNALIASQQERLSKWTRPFGGKLRFGLYNGEMPVDDKAAAERSKPEQVLCRRTLWSNPPPILVTNVTMLEYITVRKQDRPILEQSQGKLRWIILDEAHSYTGSKAAEIALLLRRVLLAFGVTPDQVRFVATSATIGEGEKVREDLMRFLRDVSGADPHRVHVIEGARRFPALPEVDEGAKIDLEVADSLDESQAFDYLARLPVVQRQIEALKKGPKYWQEWARGFENTGLDATRSALAMAKARRGDEALLPLRIHAFHRAVPGLWSCISPMCSHSPDGWPFGAIHPEAVERCGHCQSLVLPIVICRSCGEPFLEAAERNRQLGRFDRVGKLDEFEQDSEGEAIDDTDSDDDQPSGGPTIEWLLGVRVLPHARHLDIDMNKGRIADRADTGTVRFSAHDRGAPECCPACEEHGTTSNPELFRSFRFGAPFLLGNATPILLEGVPSTKPDILPKHPLPAEGRQLLSFTDSRQGTARFAAKLQSNAERNYVRSLIYHAVQDTLKADPGNAEEAEKVRNTVNVLQPLAATDRKLQPLLAEQEKKLKALTGQSEDGLAWADMRSRLLERDDIWFWMGKVWGKRDGRFQNQPEKFADFLMLRELARRTKRGNSLETMGLARLRFELIDKLPDARLPSILRAKGLTVNDWCDFLYLCLTITVRDKFALRIDKADVRWLLAKGFPRQLVGPGQDRLSKSNIMWSQIRLPSIENRGTLPRLLELALEFEPQTLEGRETINEVLRAAWDALLPLFNAPGAGNMYALDLTRASIAPITSAWFCPVTHRVLDTTFCGFSPYGVKTGQTRGQGAQAERIDLPQHPAPFPSTKNDEERIVSWLASDAGIEKLRNRGLWGNLHDRIASFSPYMRTAEHSAQQASQRLRRYENQFRAGEINILNCSTTMEMGVDIGSVSTVMMTNVPPSIASYRQRVGRAGRRRQATAMALTFCKDAPLEREAFLDPVRFLARTVAAPSVTLESRPLVQRHVNALLLAAFFAESGGEAMKTKTGGFFGYPADLRVERLPDPPSAAFHDWLGKPSTQGSQEKALAILVKGTGLEGDTTLFTEADDALNEAEAAFKAEWEGLQAQAAGLDRAAAKKAIGFQLARLCGEFLLGDLADRGVLPGHGFPTAVVQFVHKDTPDEDERREGDLDEDNRFNYRQFPSRNLDQAIRDYAPGTEVVVDGLVYRSEGVTLNWKRPASEAGVREIQSLSWFWSCNACGAADKVRERVHFCPSCGSHDVLRQYHYLKPAGFTVDHREPAHAETDIVSFVSPEPPIVAARGATWRPFRSPDLGRLRASREGVVFYTSTGGTGNSGYALCLQCGRAAPDPINAVSNPLADHRPLRFTKAGHDDLCPGNAQPFAIMRWIALGYEVQTDVAEVQFSGLRSEGAALAIASALRVALSGTLGIESNELGIAVSACRSAISAPTHSIFLFDHAAGGAGFAPHLVNLFPQLLSSAETLLDCKVEGCITGCSACVLTADLREKQDIIDRQSALKFVQEQLSKLGEPGPVDRATPEASFSDLPSDEIMAAARKGQGLIIWMPSTPDISNLTNGVLGVLLTQLPRLGKSVSICFPHETLNGLDPATRLGLRDLAVRSGISLQQGPMPAFANGARSIATVITGSGCESWATRDAEACDPGTGWGIAKNAPIVRFPQTEVIQRQAILLDSLLPHPEAAYRQFTHELDGPLGGFGDRFIAFVRPEIEKLGGLSFGSLVSLQYNDRYVKSPLSSRLMIEAASALARALGGGDAEVPFLLVSASLDEASNIEWTAPPRLLNHDWRSDEDRASVLTEIASGESLELLVELNNHKHAREFTLLFKGGQVLLITLDQGFGCWRGPGGIKLNFDFSKNHEQQARTLKAFNALLEGPDLSSYLVVSRTDR